MTPEEIKTLVETTIDEKLKSFFGSDRFIFEKKIQILDGRNIQMGRGTGTKIGTASDQKLAFYGVTPVDRPETIADPAGGGTQDTQARVAIETLIDRLQEVGLIK